MPTRLLLLALALALPPAISTAEDQPPADAATPQAGAPGTPDAPAAAAAAAPAAPTTEAAPPPPVTAATAGLPAPAVAPYPKLGFSLGIGVPNAATLSVLYRPLPFLRLSLGPSWSYAGWGINGGVVLSPVRWAVSPTLGIEGGRFFGADLTHFASDASAELQPLLRDVQLQYVAVTLGLEFGSQRGFSFAVRTGLAYVQLDLHGTGRLTNSGGTAGANDANVTVTNPSVRGTAPTVQLVFQYFL